MGTVREFHDEAARRGQLAMVARDNGEEEKAKELARQGYELELKALDALPCGAAAARSVLILAAASLAHQCGEHEKALRLIERGLAGCPPVIIYRDLLNLFEKIDAQRATRGKRMMKRLTQALRRFACRMGWHSYAEFICFDGRGARARCEWCGYWA